MLLFMVGSSLFTRAVKTSMESALIPVPLFLAECLMVWQMFPASWWLWMALVCSGKERGGTGSE